MILLVNKAGQTVRSFETYDEAHEKTGVPKPTIYWETRNLSNWTERKDGLVFRRTKDHSGIRKKYYTVYRAKDDSVVAFGNAHDCAAMLGKSEKAFRCFTHSIRSGRSKKWALDVCPMDEVEDEE